VGQRAPVALGKSFPGDNLQFVFYGSAPMRTAVIILATAGLCCFGNASAVQAQTLVTPASATENTVAAPEAKDIQVGDLLQAVKDVSLDSAVIAEGSKISVSAKKSSGGRVVLDVALADGHVVHGVPLAEIRKSFKRVAS
jgi:hypothetical protein